MHLTYAELSKAGPRPKNEDSLGFFKPTSVEERRLRGTVAALADGLGSPGSGDLASRLAINAVLKTFQESKPDLPPEQLLTALFDSANDIVYRGRMASVRAREMGTTLVIALFRNDRLLVGHIGDSRVYLVCSGQIRQVTSDHSYVAIQHNLGILTEEQAKTSENRNVITQCIGNDPTIHVDYEEEILFKDDCVVLCSDGLYTCVSDKEITDAVSRLSPEEACRQLAALAENRGTDDNLSIQVLKVDSVEELWYFRGTKVYHETNTTPNRDLMPGDVLDDRFLIVETIRQNSSGIFYKATDQETHQPVAIKLPLPESEHNPYLYARFFCEEEIGIGLNHPGLVRFVPVERRSRPYIVTEFLHGHNLAHVLHNVAPLPVHAALQLASQICETIVYLHKQGVIHYDLKPDSIISCNNGTIRVMDFGIAQLDMRHLGAGRFASNQSTPYYLAPEQIKGEVGDARSDIYSLGAMLYEMLTGIAPFEDRDPRIALDARLLGDPTSVRQLQPHIPATVDEIVLRALERDPAKRYATAAEMKIDLDNPDKVVVTGRAKRLRIMTPFKLKLYRYAWMGLAVLIPLLILVAVLLAHTLWKSH